RPHRRPARRRPAPVRRGGPAAHDRRAGLAAAAGRARLHGGARRVPPKAFTTDDPRSSMAHPVQHQSTDKTGAFFIEQGGRRIAEMTYSRTNAALVIIDHTEVDASLKGQGVGRQLLDALVAWARETQTK